MGNERSRAIEQAIEADAGWQLQRLMTHLLKADLYPSLNALPRTKDLGQDARMEPILVPHGSQLLSVGISKIATLSKVKEDCNAIRAAGHKVDAFVFATSGTVTGETRQKWEKEIKLEYGWDLIVHDSSWLMAIIERPEFEAIVDSTLNVPPPGGDFLSATVEAFDRLTARNLKAISAAIPEIGAAIPRSECDQLDDLTNKGKPVLLTGEAGTGKSGISSMLVERWKTRSKSVLLLDCGRLSRITSGAEIGAHLGLRGPAQSAIARVGRARGLLVVADQLDNLGDTEAARLVVELLAEISSLEGVAVVGVARKWDLEHRRTLAKLVTAGFAEVQSLLLDEATATELLKKVGIDPVPSELVELGRNLLNLSLIADLIKSGGPVAVDRIKDEVGLWSRYRASLEEREGPDRLPPSGRLVVAAAIRLANDTLHRPAGDCEIGFPPSVEEERLVSRGVILPLSGRVHRFRHEQLVDYFYAWDATQRILMPDTVISDIGERQAPRALRWMARIYREETSDAYRRFLTASLTSDSLAFYTRASLVDVLRAQDNPTRDEVEAVVHALRVKPDVRGYFLTDLRSLAWIRVLVECVLMTPSAEDDDGLLASVAHSLAKSAGALPELFVEAFSKIDKRRPYVALQFVRALRDIPLTHAASVVSVVVEAVNADADKGLIEQDLVAFAQRLAEGGYARIVLPIIEMILGADVRPSGHPLMGASVQPRFARELYGVPRGEIVRALAEQCPDDAVAVLENLLMNTLRIDRTARGRDADAAETAYWRAAIENSDQDSNPGLLDHQLTWLRDVLDVWVSRAPEAASKTVRRYLASPESILRRLALHIIRSHPAGLHEELARALLDEAAMSEFSIHHEYFLLLRDGFTHLSSEAKSQLLALVVAGPPSAERATIRAHHAEREQDPSVVETRVTQFVEYWIAERLWMIRDQLPIEAKNRLAKSLAELGVDEIEHPEYLSWVSSAGPLPSRAPLTTADLMAMDVNEVVDVIKHWRPPPPEPGSFPLSGPSLSSMASEFAGAVKAAPEKFLCMATALAEGVPYEYIYQFLHAVSVVAQDQKKQIPWADILDLGAKLADPASHPQLWDPTTARHGPLVPLIWALSRAISRRDLGDAELAQARTLLMRLVQHPDLAGDLGDAGDAALNHVVPLAVECLTVVASVQADRNGSRGLGPDVKGVIEGFLSRDDPSLAGVFWALGAAFARLNWLDTEWAAANVAGVFSASNAKLADAAFAGHLHANFHRTTYALLRDEFRRRVESETDSRRLEEIATHLAKAYLAGDEPLPSEGQGDGPLALLFQKHPGQAASRIAWIYFRGIHDEEEARKHGKKESWSFVETYWPRVRDLLAWRVRAAVSAGFPKEWDTEFEWYARSIAMIGEREPLEVRLEFLAQMIPSLCRRNHGAREKVIAFLAHHVDAKPLDVIRLFRKMCEGVQADSYVDGRVTPDVRKIVEAAARAGGEAQEHALAVANWYGSKGALELRDVYEQYHRT